MGLRLGMKFAPPTYSNQNHTENDRKIHAEFAGPSCRRNSHFWRSKNVVLFAPLKLTAIASGVVRILQ